MQETLNNCFGSKIFSTTLRPAKVGKHECRSTLLLHFGTRAYLFSLYEGSCYRFSTRNNCWVFLASYGAIIQSVIQSFLKTAVCGASLLQSYSLVSWVQFCIVISLTKRLFVKFPEALVSILLPRLSSPQIVVGLRLEKALFNRPKA